jgi:hypothetical protein
MATQLHLRGGADRGALHAYTLPPNGVANMAEGVNEETWPREQLALVAPAVSARQSPNRKLLDVDVFF